MDRDTIYIFGHKNPDTDSICSAIGYAELKRKLGFKAEACRLGDLNDETKFVLDYFKIPVPPKVSNVRRQVSDLDLDIVDKLSPDVSIKIAWHIMEQTNMRTLTLNVRICSIFTMTASFITSWILNPMNSFLSKKASSATTSDS